VAATRRSSTAEPLVTTDCWAYVTLIDTRATVLQSQCLSLADDTRRLVGRGIRQGRTDARHLASRPCDQAADPRGPGSRTPRASRRSTTLCLHDPDAACQGHGLFVLGPQGPSTTVGSRSPCANGSRSHSSSVLAASSSSTTLHTIRKRHAILQPRFNHVPLHICFDESSLPCRKSSQRAWWWLAEWLGTRCCDSCYTSSLPSRTWHCTTRLPSTVQVRTRVHVALACGALTVIALDRL